MFVQDADNNSGIRHASNLDIVQIIIDTETLFEGAFECSNARAARMDQCAVDVEKQKALLCVCHVGVFCPFRPLRPFRLFRSEGPKGHKGHKAQSFGACIISTAIMLPRKTSSTIAKPINIALPNWSLSCL